MQDIKLERFIKYAHDKARTHVDKQPELSRNQSRSSSVRIPSRNRQFLIKPTTINYFTGKKLSKRQSSQSSKEKALVVRIDSSVLGGEQGSRLVDQCIYSLLTPPRSRQASHSQHQLTS